MKVLHITSWYPTFQYPKTALWVSRHIEALGLLGVENLVYHLEVNSGESIVGFNRKEITGNRRYTFKSKLLPWRILEIVAALMLGWLLWKERKNSYDIINFHIAYPNLTYWKLIERWIKKPAVITEHWSAYHFNFGLDKPESLPRIQNIFNHGIPVIAVSSALASDIKRFSGNAKFQSYVVPNVVDTETFKWFGNARPGSDFFMISQWKDPKDPFAVIKAIHKLGESVSLRIGGYGPQLNDMSQLVERLGLGERIKFLGALNSSEIAKEMNDAAALIHISEYETFSVVCAEAICCGCPVIASNTGGIPEFINGSNGVLIDRKEELSDMLINFNASQFNRKTIVREAEKRFSSKSIGTRYLQVLNEIIDVKQ